MITSEEKKEMLTIFRRHYDNLKMRCDIDNATLMLVILPSMHEYAKLNKPAIIKSVCSHPRLIAEDDGVSFSCAICNQYVGW